MEAIKLDYVRVQHAAFLRKLDALIAQDAESAGQFAEEHVKQYSDFVARRGARSMKRATRHKVIRAKGGRIIRIRNPRHYASYIEYGTRAHGPVTARFLRFKIGGKFISTKWVKGIRPRKFLYKATFAAGRKLEAALVVDMATLARKF